MSFRTATVDYAARQIDVELLQSVAAPNAGQRVYIGNVGSTPKIVAGLQKAIQRYTVMLLTTANDVHFAPEQGSTLLTAIATGVVPNAGYLSHLFGIANAQALRALAKDDADTDTFGTIPDDERVINAVLVSTSVDYATGTIIIEAALTTAAGESAPFIIPVSTAR